MVFTEDLRVPARFPALDGVRGLAVLGVVAFHALRLLVLDRRGVPMVWWPLGVTRFGLDAFFVLSGFLVVSSWRSARRGRSRRAAVGEYARRRAARILPAYWLSLVVLVPLCAPHLLSSVKDLALLASVQQYLRPGLPSEVNVVYWSLTTEVHFYVLAPLVAWLLTRVNAARLVAAAIVVAVVWQLWQPLGLPAGLIAGRIDQFLIGAVAAEIVKRPDHPFAARATAALRPAGVGWVLAAALVALGVLEGAVLAGHEGPGLFALLHPAVGLVVGAGLIRFVAHGGPRLLVHPALRLAGLVSYGTYLFHYPVLAFGLPALGIGPRTPVPLAIGAVVVLAVGACGLGALSYVCVERRFLGAGRDSRGHRRAIAAAPVGVFTEAVIPLAALAR